MKAFITGAAGFIGSNLCDRLLKLGLNVIGYDNLSTGQEKFLEKALSFANFNFIKGDLLEVSKLTEAMKQCDIVFHLAANADVKDGLLHPYKDLEQNTIATYNVLEAMRHSNINKIVFSSTGSVYGEAIVIPTPEDAPFPVQTSLYGASKVACESLIQAYCEGYGYQTWIFRFVSILGERYSHGHVFDFYKHLLENDKTLRVLGNGKQRKSYLYVSDCIDAILFALEKANNKVNIFNLGTDEYCQVTDSIGWISEHLKINPALIYTGGERGWVGDNPFIFLDCSKIRTLGWKPKLTIHEGIILTLQYLQDNNWLLERR
ncbi:MAG: NAD-dependent epimerase/dehydratase family protein [Bacteroidia bacterium]|nr:NAD-dependent epimerase/dehydratase family protein [Bacteroidia bacterium]